MNLEIDVPVDFQGWVLDLGDKFRPEPTLCIQAKSLCRFMDSLGYEYQPEGLVFTLTEDQGRVGEARATLSLATAIRLHNARDIDWIMSGGFCWLPVMPSVKFRKYYLDCALTAKIVREVKLQIVDDEVVTSNDLVRFVKPEYASMLKRGFM